MSLNSLFLLAPALALGLLGCSGETIYEPYFPELLPENRGTLLVETSRVVPEVAWSLDGSEIFYRWFPLSSGPFTINAVDVRNKAVRVLDPSDRGWYESLQPSTDGDYLYYLALQGKFGNAVTLYRVATSGGQPQMLVDSVLSFSLSPDNRHIAYTVYKETCDSDCDSLFLYDVVSKSKTFLTLGRPGYFSPDGSQLLHASCDLRDLNRGWFSPSACGPASSVSVATGAIQEEPLGLEEGEELRMVRWDSNGINVVFSRVQCEGIECVTRYFVRNAASNTTRKVWEYSYNIPWGGQQFAAWSADGWKAAFWTWPRCIGLGETGGGCQFRLHVVDVPTSGAQIVAVGGAEVGGMTAFSPDAGEIAYVFGSRMYMTDVP